MTTTPPPELQPTDQRSTRARQPERQALYDESVAMLGRALGRLAAGYERELDRRQDLLQDIHFALWRSFESFDGRCALRTWVYRVAHNVASSHALRERRRRAPFVGLEALDEAIHDGDEAPDARLASGMDAERQRAQLAALLEQLAPADRQLMLLYLEGLDAAAIGEVTGLSSANVATKVHRIKRVLAARVQGSTTTRTSSGATHGR